MDLGARSRPVRPEAPLRAVLGKSRIGIAVVSAALALAAASGAAYVYLTRPAPESPEVVGGAELGGPFTLVDHTGQEVSAADFRGRLLLVFFGYTYCPDVCPTTLATMSAALDALGPAAEGVQPIFITIDPERDTPEILAQYVAHFHPRLVALTGTPEQIAAVAKDYRVYYAKAYGEGGPEGDRHDYLMDHSSTIFVMDAQGRFLTVLRHGLGPEEMAERIRPYLSG